jgi:hypothetical protein
MYCTCAISETIWKPVTEKTVFGKYIQITKPFCKNCGMEKKFNSSNLH